LEQQIQSFELKIVSLEEDLRESEEKLSKVAVMLKDKDIQFNVVTDENSGIVDACNNLVDELNERVEHIAELEAAMNELCQENQKLKCQLLSKKRDLPEFSQQFQSFSLVKSPGSNIGAKRLKANKENATP